MEQGRDREAFLRKIADGKLLLRFSYMTFNVTCDCCRSEEKLTHEGQPDTLRHKSWCVVLAARQFFPFFVPSLYPVDLDHLRGYLTEDFNNPQFTWFDDLGEGE